MKSSKKMSALPCRNILEFELIGWYKKSIYLGDQIYRDKMCGLHFFSV